MSEHTNAPEEKVPAATAEGADTHAAEAHEEHVAAEVDRPPTALLTGLVAATMAIVIGLVVGINEVFKSTVEGEISAKVLEHQAPALRELRAKEQDALNRYRWADQKAGVVRVPLDRAIELTLNDYKNKPIVQQPEAGTGPAQTPSPAPAPGPAPETAPEPKK